MWNHLKPDDRKHSTVDLSFWVKNEILATYNPNCGESAVLLWSYSPDEKQLSSGERC